MPKVIYEKRGEVTYVTLDRPEVKDAIDVETHELFCEIWADCTTTRTSRRGSDRQR